MKIRGSDRARGGNRGGNGGGYELTDPDYDKHKLERMRAEYLALASEWRETYLAGLSRFERDYVTGKVRHEI